MQGGIIPDEIAAMKSSVRTLRDEVLKARGRDGVWDDALVGKAFATACALLVLEVPLRYLPIFQR